MKKELISFALLGLVINFQNSSDTVVENYVKSEATGDNASVETNINTKVNQTETTVKTNQSGEVEVNVKNGKVEVKTSKGVTPTIIIKQGGETVTPVSSVAGEETENQEEKMERIEIRIQNFIKSIFQKLLNFFGGVKI